MLEIHSVAKNAKIYVAGHDSLAGSAIVRALERRGYANILFSDSLNLLHYESVADFFKTNRPEYVFFCAAKTGGIGAHQAFPGTFMYQNLLMQSHVIHEAMRNSVKRLLFLGSSCLYPRDCAQPMKEEHHLTGSLELTNRAYAVARISGIEMCWAYNREYKTRFFAAMPTNLYGPKDNFELKTAYVLPAMLKRMHLAKIEEKSFLTLWGTGKARREFLHVDDFADAALFLMALNDNQFNSLFYPDGQAPLINVGCGEDLSIEELAYLVADVVGYQGQIFWDSTQPDGHPQKLLDVSRLSQFGWKPSISLRDGIYRVYSDESSKW